MASTTPYGQLTGAVEVWVAPVGETVTAVNATPAGNWTKLGATDGDQSQQNKGGLTYFRDSDHQGPVKAVRPEEDIIYKFTIVNLTLENWSRILSTVANVVAGTSPTSKKLPLKRGNPTEYALMFRGVALSPYGVFPGEFVCPRGVFEGEPTATFGPKKRAELACEFHALEDDNQADADKLGWLIVQSA